MEKLEKCICAKSWPRLDFRKGKPRIICANCGRRCACGKDMEEAIDIWNEETKELVSIWGRMK